MKIDTGTTSRRTSRSSLASATPEAVAEFLSRKREEGISMRAFCKERGISIHSFSYVKKKLAKDGGAAPSAVLAPLDIVPSPAPRPQGGSVLSGVVLDLPSGVRISVGGITVGQLAELAGSVGRALPC